MFLIVEDSALKAKMAIAVLDGIHIQCRLVKDLVSALEAFEIFEDEIEAIILDLGFKYSEIDESAEYDSKMGLKLLSVLGKELVIPVFINSTTELTQTELQTFPQIMGHDYDLLSIRKFAEKVHAIA